MRLKLLSTLMLSLLLAGGALAQGTLTGTVTDAETGETLPGVNVLIEESGQGAATDLDGVFRISNIEPDTYTVRLTYIGYSQLSAEVQIQDGENELDVELEIDSFVLGDVVVTALGIQRSERSIGYAAQEVSGQAVAGSREPNLVNALAGRTAGVQINSSSGQPGAGSRIVIRGNASMLGNNQPLFVVDGVPISNESDSNIDGNTLFTGGTSNRAIDLDANNIENISVLKGASATALYGSRAANGAIIITTRTGEFDQAPVFSYSTSVGWSQAFTDGYQHDYLGGTQGYYFNGLPLDRGGYVEPGAPGTNPQMTQSWGPHKDEVSQQVLDDLGVSEIQTFDPRADFYQTGTNVNHSFRIAGGTPSSRYTASVSHLNENGIVPETGFDRTNLSARFGTQLGDRVHVETSANYSDSRNNWVGEGNGPLSYLFGLNFAPISFDLREPTFEDGSQRMNTPSFNNPNWLAENNGFTSEVGRFMGNTSISVDLLPWLTISERIGIDTYTDKRKGRINVGTRGFPEGRMYDQVINRTEINSDLTATAVRPLNENFGLEVLVGNNINVRNFSSEEITGIGLNIPGFFHISNANSSDPYEDLSERRLVSVYSQAVLDYRDIVYLTLTARNDWSSTLPEDNNSYFYPSASVGFVFTDAFDVFRGSFLSLGKLRASISQIGNDAPAYSLATNFVQANPSDGVRGEITYPFNGVNAYRLQSAIGNPDLRPEISTEVEFGIDLRLFEGRARVDASWYHRNTVDQIFEVPTSSATGFMDRLANAGEIENRGIELTLGGTPIQTSSFRWNLDMNFSRNQTDIVSLAPGVDNIFLGGFTVPQIRIADEENGYGVIWGFRYERNEDGELLIGDNGLPLMAPDLGPIGNIEPDWRANLRTTFDYRSWSLSALFDRRKGGDIMNMDLFYTSFYGTSALTANRGDTYLYDGVHHQTGDPNDVEITRDQNYYQGHFAWVDENFVEDGSFLKLREISLSYSLPQNLVDRTPFRDLTLAGTGRNLWISSDFSYKDPEGSLYGTGNAQGFYHMVTPATRSWTVSLNVSF